MPHSTNLPTDPGRLTGSARSRSLRGLAIGFISIALVLSLVIILGINRMAALDSKLRQIVGNHLVKMRLVTEMRIAARERTLGLDRMINVTDPFDRNDEWMRFNANATRFSAARLQLLKMPRSELEKKILDDQSKWTHKTIPLQDEVVDLVMADRLADAKKVLYEQAIPNQNKALHFLDRLSEEQEKAAHEARRSANNDYQRTRALLIMLFLVAITLSAIIARTTIRYTRKAEARLYREKENAQVTLYSIAEGVITTNGQGRIESLNAAAKHITGWSTKNAKGKKISDILDTLGEGDNNAIENLVSLALVEGGVHTASSEVTFKGSTTSEHVIEASAAPIRNESSKVDGAVLIFRDITEMHALSHELRLHASHDSLTGLLNRREFETRLGEAIHDARENSSEHALCFLDLDMFKIVNDTCGHIAGDELLRQIGTILASSIRRSDVIARLGGDEFGLLMHDCTLSVAKEVCENIRSKIKNNRFVWEDHAFEIGVSIGIAPITEMSGNTHEVLREVDSAVYEAKDHGRNRVCVRDKGTLNLDRRQGEISWIQTINQALEKDRLRLYYQEIRSLQEQGNPATHAELLLRMQDDDGNIISPMSFLPAAERFHLMPVIDRWVIHKAFQEMARIRNAKKRVVIKRFNINLSGQSLSDPDLLDYIRAELAMSHIAANDVCFEITETAAISNLSAASTLIDELRKIGFRFALDDFGSGLSSFGYLKNLKVDYLKIDGTFIRDIASDTADHAMVRSINQVAHVMGIQTVAEYIENEDISIMATGIGIDYGQGIFLAEVRPLEELLNANEIKSKLRVVK
jgi:diguanylate cyclase (GGDEF)-like protein/PAS domain S-box-containing protein